MFPSLMDMALTLINYRFMENLDGPQLLIAVRVAIVVGITIHRVRNTCIRITIGIGIQIAQTATTAFSLGIRESMSLKSGYPYKNIYNVFTKNLCRHGS